MSGLGSGMKRLVWAVVAAASLAVGCDGSTQPLTPEPPGSATGSGGTPVPMDPPIPAASCRWEGYGIGSDGRRQCDAQHVMAHAWAQCAGAGGKVGPTRGVFGECPAEAGEVEVYCCYDNGLPAASDTPIAVTSGSMPGRVAPGPG